MRAGLLFGLRTGASSVARLGWRRALPSVLRAGLRPVVYCVLRAGLRCGLRPGLRRVFAGFALGFGAEALVRLRVGAAGLLGVGLRDGRLQDVYKRQVHAGDELVLAGSTRFMLIEGMPESWE